MLCRPLEGNNYYYQIGDTGRKLFKCTLCDKGITEGYVIYDDKTDEYFHQICFHYMRKINKKGNPMIIIENMTKKLTDASELSSEIFAKHLMMAFDMPVTKPTDSQLRRWERYRRHGDPFRVSNKIREKSFANGRII